MTFPVSPSVGDTHQLASSGPTYTFTSDNIWVNLEAGGGGGGGAFSPSYTETGTLEVSQGENVSGVAEQIFTATIPSIAKQAMIRVAAYSSQGRSGTSGAVEIKVNGTTFVSHSLPYLVQGDGDPNVSSQAHMVVFVDLENYYVAVGTSGVQTQDGTPTSYPTNLVISEPTPVRLGDATQVTSIQVRIWADGGTSTDSTHRIKSTHDVWYSAN